MMVLNEHYTLSNRALIPKLGLGTWLIPDLDAAEAVRLLKDYGNDSRFPVFSKKEQE